MSATPPADHSSPSAPKSPAPQPPAPPAHASPAHASPAHPSPAHASKRKPARRRNRRRRRAPPGTAPGTLVADPEAPKPVMGVFAYGPAELVERELRDVADLRALCGRHSVLWVDVDGLGDIDTIRSIGELFGLHRLELEDVVNVHQRAKIDTYGEHLFIVVRMVERGERLDTEQLSLFLGRDFVLTFQERPGDGFGPVRERLRQVHGSLRAAGPDYLAYALLDAAVDEYFPVLEDLGERIEKLEDEIALRPSPEHLRELHRVKRDLLTLRRAVWPLREALNQLQRDDGGLVQPATRPYLNDLYDHTVQLMDLVETYREIASGLLEVYLSSMSHRLNEVMKVLTVLATIFIPLTFMSSIWGMNFKHMPELEWRYGYAAALLFMFAVAIALLVFFQRSGWIGRRPRRPELESDAKESVSGARTASDARTGPNVPGPADERAR